MTQGRRFETWWMRTWPHRWHVRWHVPQFLRACPEPFRGEVLEIGAGRGYTSRRILETFPQVELTVVDRDAKAVAAFDRLQKDYGRRLHVQEAAATQLPFNRNDFDIVLAINVMRYLEEGEAESSLREFLRVLTPGGMLGISEYAAWDQKKYMSSKRLEELLSQEGAEILHTAKGRGYDLWVRKPHGFGRS